MTTPNVLTWFTVKMFIYDVEQPLDAGTSEQPNLADVSGFVDFFPGSQSVAFPTGYSVIVPDLNHGDGTSGDTEVPLAPITGRTLNGALTSLVSGDPVGVELLDFSAILTGLSSLFYHVRFREMTWQDGTLFSLGNYAFQAPGNGSTLLLSSNTVTKFPYGGP